VLFVCFALTTILGQNKVPRPTRNLNFVNQCNYTIYAGSQGNPLPALGGWEMGPSSKYSFAVPSTLSAARVWVRTDCTHNNLGHLVCATGDCPLPLNYYGPNNDGTHCEGIGGIPPASLAEFTLGGTGTGDDFYDLSLVDGFNTPIKVTQIGGTKTNSLPFNSPYNCGNPSCPGFNYNRCPPELREYVNGQLVACMSICSAIYNTAQRAKWPILQKYWTENDPYTGFPMKNLLCCACGRGTGCNDPISEFCCSPYDPNAKGGKCIVQHWPLASDGQRYDQVFKTQCPDAYSWQFDDSQSTYQCINADYTITFCP